MLVLASSTARVIALVSVLALTVSARPVHDHELAPVHRQLLGPRQGLLGKLFGGGDDNDTSTAADATTTATGRAEQTSAAAGGGGAATTTQAIAVPPTTTPVQQARTATTARQATSPITAAADQAANSVSSAPAPSASSASSANAADPSSSPSPSTSVPVSANLVSPSSSATEVQKAAVQQTSLNAGTTVTQIISSAAPGSTTPVTANHLQAPSPSPLSPANSLFPLVISGIVIGALLALALVFLLVKRVIIPSSRKSSRWDADLPWQSDDTAGPGVGGARPWSEVGSVHDGPGGVGRSGSTRSAREQMLEVGNGYPAPHRGIASSEAFGYGGGYDGGHYDHDARVLGAVDAYRVGPNAGQGAGWGHGPPMEPATAAMPPPMYENAHARDMGLRDEKGRLV